jgi:pimeloyl-ACP methyl ester carboxylesterase
MVLDDGAVFYFPLDDCVGVLTSDCGYSPAGEPISLTETGSLASVPPLASGSATDFANGGLDVDMLGLPGSAGSLEFWIKSDFVSFWENVFCCQPQFSIHGGGLPYFHYTWEVNGPTPIDNDLPHHIVLTWTTSEHRLYVDGELVAGGPGTATNVVIDQIGYPLQVGDLSAFFRGELDELAIYPTALTATQVLGHYSAGGEAHTPLIFIPGVAGSALKNDYGTRVWPPSLLQLAQPDDNWANRLRLAPDGIMPLDPTDPGNRISVALEFGASGVIRSILGRDQYGSALDRLEDLGRVIGVDLFPFAYDWRRSADYNAARLGEFIGQIRDDTGHETVDLLAHSQGGLVALALLDDDSSVGSVRRVVTMGTPVLGTPRFHAIASGYQCFIDWVVCWLSVDKVAELLANFPGSLELAPSPRYFTGGETPLWIEHSGGVEERLGYNDVRRTYANKTLYDQAATWHGNLEVFSPVDPSVELMRYVGIGFPTRRATVLTNVETCAPYPVPGPPPSVIFECRTELVPRLHTDGMTGDGTVVERSAALFDPATGLDLRSEDAERRFEPLTHNALIKDRALLSEALQWLDTGEAPLAALRSAPPAGVLVEIVGPSYGHISDSGGFKTGYVSAGTDPDVLIGITDIADSIFDVDMFGGIYFAAEAGPIAGSFVATEASEFQVKVSAWDNGTTASAAVFEHQELEAGGVLGLTATSGTNLSAATLEVDLEGDGVVDHVLAPTSFVDGGSAADTTSPTVAVTVAQGRVVDVTAADGGGSGVHRIEVATDDGTGWREYADPFAGAAGTVFVRATDRAGNSGFDHLEIHGAGLVDPATGRWYLPEGTSAPFYFGDPGDAPFVGDWDCDGIDTPGLYRQSDGYAYLRNSNTQGIADVRFFFGNPGDVPMAGDFDGDGCDTLSLYRPSSQEFFIINELGANDGGLGAADFSFVFGNPGDEPVVGDWDGDGLSTIGLHRRETGFFYYRNANATGNADDQFFFGDGGDLLVSGDWNGNEADSPGLFRPSDATFYFRYTMTQGNADFSLPLGASSYVPVAGVFD